MMQTSWKMILAGNCDDQYPPSWISLFRNSDFIKKHPRFDPKATVTGTLDLEEHDSSIAFASVSCTNQN